MYVCMYVFMCMYVCMYECMRVYIYVYIYIVCSPSNMKCVLSDLKVQNVFSLQQELLAKSAALEVEAGAVRARVGELETKGSLLQQVPEYPFSTTKTQKTKFKVNVRT